MADAPHPWDLVGRNAAQALLDDPSPYWRHAACEALIQGIRQNSTPDRVMRDILEAIASYDRNLNPPWGSP